MGIMTARGIASMAAGAWAAEPAPRGAGVLQARKLDRDSVAFYFRYTGPDGKRVRLPIGRNIPLSDARKFAAELSRRFQAGDKDLRTALAAEVEERQRSEAEARRVEQDAKARDLATVGALMSAYVQQLRQDGKASAKEVEGSLNRHVRDAWPALWSMPASKVSADDLLEVLHRLISDGKLRQAGKVRAHLAAAYTAAIRARRDPRSLQVLRDLKVSANPARDLIAIDGSSTPKERALTLSELRNYWKRIAAMEDVIGAVLRFHLLTGGQRIKQLGRLTIGDFDSDARTVCLQDGKGRRRSPRRHYVPLTDPALAALGCIGRALGPYLVSVTQGRTGVTDAVIGARIRRLCSSMADAGELEKGTFTAADLRRTVETRLAAAGVSKGVRAQLQSHGLNGVQARHYDQHDYLAEKRDALDRLYQLLQ